VGLGGFSLTSAIRLHTEAEQCTAHEPRRIVREGTRWFHQVRFGNEWHDVCEFTLEEMPPIDRELGNWFVSTHPQSHFKNRLMVAQALAGGQRITVLNRDLSIRQRDGQVVTQHIASPEELLDILNKHFGLRFPPDTRFGPPDSPWPT
jgi:N-hydroxyarylamine O-acetyltransferase